MNLNLFVYNIQENSMYDYADITEEITVTTNRSGSAGKLQFTYLKKAQIPVNMTEGAKVQFYVDSLPVFEGYVFSMEQNRWGSVSVTAWDQIRYLLGNESYSFIGMQLGEIITQIAVDKQLKTGELESTGYAIPYLTKEDTKCLDIIEYASMLTQNNTGKVYTFYDEFGKLSLKEAGHMVSNCIIGNGSLLTEYKYKSDIDSETYNQIKLVKPNKKTGKADVYLFKDSENIKKWGILQLYEKVNENLNEAQIEQQGNTMMAYYNRVLKSISVEAVGVTGIRAGMMVLFQVADIPELEKGYVLLLDKVNHKYSKEGHNMTLDAKILLI